MKNGQLEESDIKIFGGWQDVQRAFNDSLRGYFAPKLLGEIRDNSERANLDVINARVQNDLKKYERDNIKELIDICVYNESKSKKARFMSPFHTVSTFLYMRRIEGRITTEEFVVEFHKSLNKTNVYN